MFNEGTFLQWRVGVRQFVGVTREINDVMHVCYVDDFGDFATEPLADIEKPKKLKL